MCVSSPWNSSLSFCSLLSDLLTKIPYQQHLTSLLFLFCQLTPLLDEKGQEFKPHFDGSFPRDEDEMSFFTFIIYLNGDLQGGETAFFPDQGEEVLVNPTLGQALVFWHKTKLSPYHAGLPHFSEGKVKYVLRSDLMYRRGEYVGQSAKKSK